MYQSLAFHGKAAPKQTLSSSEAARVAITEFLTFKLGDKKYGIDLLRVQEIRSYEAPVHFANAPAFIKGVINLRGVIVAVIDLRIKFKLEPVNYDASTVVIVLNIGQKVVGMVVDAVSDVITFAPEQLRPVSDCSAGIDSEHLLAMVAVQERKLMWCDIEKIFASSDLGLLASTAH